MPPLVLFFSVLVCCFRVVGVRVPAVDEVHGKLRLGKQGEIDRVSPRGFEQARVFRPWVRMSCLELVEVSLRLPVLLGLNTNEYKSLICRELVKEWMAVAGPSGEQRILELS